MEVPLLDRGGWLLTPGRLYIGRTKEYTETIGLAPRIDGRSSLGRLGVFAHITAGQGDNGFIGTWTVELAVVEPVILYPGQRIFQIHRVSTPTRVSYNGDTGNTSGRYQGQIDPTLSLMDRDDG